MDSVCSEKPGGIRGELFLVDVSGVFKKWQMLSIELWAYHHCFIWTSIVFICFIVLVFIKFNLKMDSAKNKLEPAVPRSLLYFITRKFPVYGN